MPIISIIIPIYNIKDYLEICIESILNQIHDNFEILLVNDGSTDGSELICKKYEQEYDEIYVINKLNGGLSDARNTGLLNAKGKYILFLDGDDFLQENILVDLTKFTLSKDNPDIVIYDYAKFFQSKNEYNSVDRNIISEIIGKKNGVNVLKYLLKNEKSFNWFAWQCLYKKDMLMQNNLFFEKGRLYEDVLWLPNVLCKAQSVEYFNKTVYIYRLEREGQITSTVTQKSLIDNVYIPVHWATKLDQFEIEKELKELLMNNFTIRYYYSIWFSGFIEYHERKAVVELLKKNKHLLKYSNGAITKITGILVETIGFNNTSSLFKSVIKLKRRISI